MSKVETDWQEPMIPQRTMQPSIERVTEQFDSRCGQQTYHLHYQAFIPQPAIYYAVIVSLHLADSGRLK